jgi:hypothetical protein
MTRALSYVRPIPRRGLSRDEAAMYAEFYVPIVPSVAG